MDIKCQQFDRKIMKDSESLESNYVIYGTEVRLDIIKNINWFIFICFILKNLI